MAELFGFSPSFQNGLVMPCMKWVFPAEPYQSHAVSGPDQHEQLEADKILTSRHLMMNHCSVICGACLAWFHSIWYLLETSILYHALICLWIFSLVLNENYPLESSLAESILSFFFIFHSYSEYYRTQLVNVSYVEKKVHLYIVINYWR